MAVPEDLAQDAQREMERSRSEDRINREAEEAEGFRTRSTIAIPTVAPHSYVLRCHDCGQLGHCLRTHSDCLMNPKCLLSAGSNAKANAPPTILLPPLPSLPLLFLLPLLSLLLMLLMLLLNHAFSEMEWLLLRSRTTHNTEP